MLKDIDFRTIYPFALLDGRVVQERRVPNPGAWVILPKEEVAEGNVARTVWPNIDPDYISLMEESISYNLIHSRTKRLTMTTYVGNPAEQKVNLKSLLSNPSQGDFEPGSFSGRQIGEETYVDKWRMEAPGFQFRMITLDGNVVLLIRLLGSPFDRRVHKREDFRFTDEEALWAEEFVIQTLKGFARQGYTRVTQP